LLAGKDVPNDIVQRIARAAQEVKAEPDYVAKLAEGLAVPAAEKTPEEFGRWLNNERRVWSGIVERAHISAE
jgi:tripartite-type tricarboxylate transporter receptor subunit TctC